MSDFKFHDESTPTKNADKHANAFLSGAFTNAADGKTLNAVEKGFAAQVGGGGGGKLQTFHQQPMQQQREQEGGVLEKRCEECGRMILSGPAMQSGQSFFHKDCWERHSKSVKTSVIAPPPSTVDRDSGRNRKEIELENERKRLLADKIGEGKIMCPACNKVIGGLSVQLEGRHYHTECLVCSQCRNPLVDRAVASVDPLVCSECHLGGAKCVGCLKPLTEGAYVKAGKHNYHPNCFNCNVCKKNLRGQPYAEVKGYPRCGQCVNRP